MSGRPYRWTPNGSIGGVPIGIEDCIPHQFELKAPKPHTEAKAKAIRRAIQRRCKEKNWKKLACIQQYQTKEDEIETNTHEVIPNSNLQENKSFISSPTTTENGKTTQDKDGVLKETPKEVVGDVNTLQELELKLKELTEQKHNKFQQLKEILCEEAKSKTFGTKKRRLDGQENGVL